jgi:hypothetical protein
VLSIEFARAGDKGVDGLGAGDVVGPASAVDNSLVLYDTTTGKLVKQGLWTLATGQFVPTTDNAYDIGASGGAQPRAIYAKTNMYVNGVAVLTGITSVMVTGALTYTPTSITGLTGVQTAAAIKTGLTLVKADVGLGNVDNTSDANKPVSTATNTQLNAKLALGLYEMSLPAPCWLPRTTAGCGGLATAETTTNKLMVSALPFDTATKEYAQFNVTPPKGWNGGTVLFRVRWKHPATTTNFGVAFGLSGVSHADNQGLDALTFGTEVIVTDTGGTTDNNYLTAYSAAVTLAGAAKTEAVTLQLSRDVSNAGDTLAVDAQVLEVIVAWTLDGVNDA